MYLSITFHQFIDSILTMAQRFYNLITTTIIPFMINNYFFRLLLILILLSFIIVLAINLLDISTSGIFNYSEDYEPKHFARHSSAYIDSVNPELDYPEDDSYVPKHSRTRRGQW